MPRTAAPMSNVVEGSGINVASTQVLHPALPPVILMVKVGDKEFQVKASGNTPLEIKYLKNGEFKLCAEKYYAELKISGTRKKHWGKAVI